MSLKVWQNCLVLLSISLDFPLKFRVFVLRFRSSFFFRFFVVFRFFSFFRFFVIIKKTKKTQTQKIYNYTSTSISTITTPLSSLSLSPKGHHKASTPFAAYLPKRHSTPFAAYLSIASKATVHYKHRCIRSLGTVTSDKSNQT